MLRKLEFMCSSSRDPQAPRDPLAVIGICTPYHATWTAKDLQSTRENIHAAYLLYHYIHTTVAYSIPKNLAIFVCNIMFQTTTARK